MSRRRGPEHVPLTPALLREWPVEPADRGTVLVLGGARTVPGAVLLAGTAALRAGAGTLQLAAAERHAVALGVAVPESSVFGLPETPSGAIAPKSVEQVADLLASADTVVIGPGLTGVDETGELLDRVLPRIAAETRVVFDAFALGALSHQPARAEPLAGRLVLTPNATEAAFLLGIEEHDVADFPRAAYDIARRYEAIVVLMGAVATPEGRLWADGSGHVGLATSGSGDVLAGLVGGFLARQAEPAQAACWATHVHAVAGQRLIPRTGRTGLLARDLLEQVAEVIAELGR